MCKLPAKTQFSKCPITQKHDVSENLAPIACIYIYICKHSDIVYGDPSDILSDLYSDRQSGILSEIRSYISLDILFDLWSGIGFRSGPRELASSGCVEVAGKPAGNKVDEEDKCVWASVLAGCLAKIYRPWGNRLTFQDTLLSTWQQA